MDTIYDLLTFVRMTYCVRLNVGNRQTRFTAGIAYCGGADADLAA